MFRIITRWRRSDRYRRRAALFTAAVGTLQAATATAQSPMSPRGVHGVLFGGMASVPSFPGAGTQQVIPYVAGQLGGNGWQLALDGTAARLSIRPGSWWEAGPALNLTFGREARDLARTTPASLSSIGLAAELGVFVAVSRGVGLTPGDEARLMLQVVRDVSAVNDGHTALLRASYRRPLGARTLLIGSASGTFVDATWNRRYFSVAPVASSVLTLPVLTARHSTVRSTLVPR
ncbi:MAG: MipA/OmpV family protein [Gemmatimonas sp.]|uniref:MipA/OmpV family protein n=1 Tax=Gemmatimonas sp. TaxID=1962908 RepID=UPI0031BCA50A|nr:MipA/OmpV family protein [Gemmatimonas sp.]